MTRFLVDEDLPKSLAVLLTQNGFPTESSRQAGLTSKPDTEVYAYACRAGRALITRDHGFGNVQTFPLGAHPGILIAGYSWKISSKTVCQMILETIQQLAPEEIQGNLVILEAGRVRLKRLNP